MIMKKHLSMSLPFLLLLLTFIVYCTFGAKILVFSPTLSRSHMISNGRVADALAKDGHNVTLLEVEYMVPLNSLNASTQARVLHVHGPFAPDQKVDIQKLMAENSFDPPSLINTIASMYFLHDALNYACDAFLTREHALLEQLKSERFDMLITEQLSFCGSGLSPLLGIPTHILLNSAPIMEHVATLIGLPNPSSYVPAVLESNLPDRMTLGQRFQNLLRHLVASCFLHWGIDPTTGIYRRLYGPDFPDLRDVVKDSPLQLVSADEFVDFPRPLFPNAIYIGGLGSEETKKGADLSEPFRSVMTKGPRGVVYFSMGTVMRTSDMREQFKRNLFKVFGQLTDYQFIVKVEAGDQLAEELAKPLANVFTTTWAPQTALLNHPRLRLFITHGGYNSLMEAARAGIPLITMGFFADQYRNGRVAERNGWGMPFEKRLLLESVDEFREAILRVVEDPKYKENAKRAQLLVLNKPFSAYERLTQNIRFLELSGGRLPELLSHSRNMTTVELYNLDLLALGVCAALALMALWAVFAWMAWKWVGKRTAIWLWNRLNTLLPGEEEKQKKKIA